MVKNVAFVHLPEG